MARYLRRSRQFRGVGGVLGWFAPSVASALGAGIDRSFPAQPSSALVGCMIGALIAEGISIRRPAGDHRSALLISRRLRDYMSPALLGTERVLAATVIGLCLIAGFVRPDAGHHPNGLAFGVARWWAPLSGATAVVLVLIESLQRWIVAQPQPGGTPEELGADDAIRASSLHVCAAVAIGLFLSALGPEVDWLRNAWLLPDPVSPLLVLIEIAAMLGVVGVWIDLVHLRPWRVDRQPSPA